MVVGDDKHTRDAGDLLVITVFCTDLKTYISGANPSEHVHKYWKALNCTEVVPKRLATAKGARK